MDASLVELSQLNQQPQEEVKSKGNEEIITIGEATAVFLDDKNEPSNILCKCPLTASSENPSTIVLTSEVINNIKELNLVIKKDYALMLFLRLNIGSGPQGAYVLSQNEFTFNDLLNSYDMLKEGVNLPFTAQLRDELAIMFVVEKLPYVAPKVSNKKKSRKFSLKTRNGKTKSVGVVSGSDATAVTPMEHRSYKLISFGLIRTQQPLAAQQPLANQQQEQPQEQPQQQQQEPLQEPPKIDDESVTTEEQVNDSNINDAPKIEEVEYEEVTDEKNTNTSTD
jgi:hypothetical protein